MKFRFALSVILLIALVVPINARAAEENVPTFRQDEIVPGELIVIMQPGKKVRDLTLPEKAKASLKKHYGLEKLHAGVINVPAGEESAYIEKLKKLKHVLVVEPNYVVKAFVPIVPNDTHWGLQYGPSRIQADEAWNTTTGSSSVIIAIIDSGIDSLHPEFAGRIVSPYDFIDNDTVPQDTCGHGTHVAGIAAAAGNNGQGIAGIAWGASIMPLRVLTNDGQGRCTTLGGVADLADALVFAADHGAQIINLSLGIGVSSALLENATYYAYSQGSAVFAASGNAGTSSVYYPAAHNWVMAVGATNSSDARANFSNYGAALDLMAPGNLIYSTMPMQPGFLYNTFGYSTQYDYLSGTSMATPHVSGAAALLLSMPGNCFNTPDKLYRALIDSALDLTALPASAGWDTYTGHGLVQIADAMAACALAPPPSFTVQYDLVNSIGCNSLAPYNWREINSTPAQTLSPGGNAGYTGLLALPFTFNFGGGSYTNLRAHANGYLSLGNDPANTPLSSFDLFATNFMLPTATYPNNFIAPFWDDLTDNSGMGRLYAGVIGSSPSREFVIEYVGFKRVGAPDTNLNFEVILYEGSNKIKMQYRALSGAGSDGSSATVGLEYGNNAVGFGEYQYSYNRNGALQNGLALLFVPYANGASPLPSSACPRQTRAMSVGNGEPIACATSPGAFDMDVPAGELAYPSALKVQQLDSTPAMLPASYLDLKRYADIQLRYESPATSLVPMPQATVCYEYTAQDLLAAGGHPENLFIAAHDENTNAWSALPTTVDSPNSRLLALAPHFSYYGVATLNPQRAAKGKGLGLPVTGAPLGNELILFLIFVGFVFLSSRVWLIRKTKR